jgi:hypothetical protein
MRSEWMNLNGTWDFAETDSDQSYLDDEAYPDRIIAPFCRESKLSGLGRTGFVKNVWYRRTFELPKTWKSPRTILHVGACDYATTVWLNGKLLGTHRGGSSPISFEITKQLQPKNVIIVHAFDDTRSGLQPTGKQSHQEQSYGCMYTRTTGIWQTVWLEGVGSSYIRDFRIETDPANSRVILQTEVDGPCEGLTIKAAAFADGKVVGVEQAPADWRNGRLVLSLSQKRLWSPDDPFLYQLKLVLLKDGKPVDIVYSYFGLRSVSIDGPAITINGKPVFQRLILDQGFYPDGIWTAPTDEALRKDIELSQAAGYNGARLHQKVFEPRYLYWADKMGYLVWGEFPSWGFDYANPAGHLAFLDEWTDVVRRDRNHPSIIGWCPFNETSRNAAEIQNSIYAVTRAIDPSRPILDTSGYTHSLAEPEVLDTHDYDQNPESFHARYTDMSPILPARYGGPTVKPGVPFMVSEFGGIWLKESEEFYTRYKSLVDALLDSDHFGFCYTQLTDVEQEQNGLYDYNRKPKFDVKRVHDITARKAAIEKGIKPKIMKPLAWTVIVGAFPDKDLAKEWRYTTSLVGEGVQPPPQQGKVDWTKPEFDDSSWQAGLGGLGSKGGWEWATRTPWNTSDIWIRQAFDYDGKPFDQALLVIHYDNATEMYLNGKRIWKGSGWNDQYGGFDVTTAVKDALMTGRNVIAVHTHQDGGGQFIDLALLIGSQ